MWKDIRGYENLYQVSDDGKVRSTDRVTTGKRRRKIKGTTLKASINSCGYMVVTLSKEGKSKTKRIHRLVADAFIPNVYGKPYINHLDGNPQNNNVGNLEWCTQQENVQHAYDTGLRKPNRKLSREQVKMIQATYKPYSRAFGTSALGMEFGVTSATIWRAVHSKQERK